MHAPTASQGSSPGLSRPRRSGPELPQPRGPITAWLVGTLTQDPPARHVTDHRLRSWVDALPGDSAGHEDAQLALHCIYELSYRGFAGVDDRWERDPAILTLRLALEDRFEHDLRDAVDATGLTRAARTIEDVLDGVAGPSLSSFMERQGTHRQFVELCIHRSAYQLKEADTHTWALPRFTGARKAAFVEIQTDEYGNGVTGQAHADLFADLLRALGVDAAHGAHTDALPAVTLATDNLITLLGTQHRLRSALLGHLAAFELTSVTPMSRYSNAARRLGLGPRVERFYDVHVDADEHHGHLASAQLVGGDPEGDGLSTPEILFGAAALMTLEDRLTRHVLGCWSRGRSSLRQHHRPGVNGSTRPAGTSSRARWTATPTRVGSCPPPGR